MTFDKEFLEDYYYNCRIFQPDDAGDHHPVLHQPPDAHHGPLHAVHERLRQTPAEGHTHQSILPDGAPARDQHTLPGSQDLPVVGH